jgi:mono/diheme cytochrome c family protein
VKRTMLRVLAVVASGVTLSAVGVGLYVARTWDRVYDAPLPNVHASGDPEVIARGAYLVNGPAHCVECHANREEAEAAYAQGRAPHLSGGRRFDAPPLGAIYSGNITPDADTGIGRYSDPQIARMLRYSVRPDGHASVQLLMPFGNMSDEDLTAIISYLRSRPAVRNPVPDAEWTVVGAVVRTFAPAFRPRSDVHAPTVSPRGPTAARGEYLAKSVGNCVTCHTKFDPISLAKVGPEFSGGNEMEPDVRPGLEVDRAVWFRPPNLTPATDSALNKFPDRDTFVARFQRGGRHYSGSPMPWECFGRMSDEDLAALYEYLHSLTPQRGPKGDPTFRKTG